MYDDCRIATGDDGDARCELNAPTVSRSVRAYRSSFWRLLLGPFVYLPHMPHATTLLASTVKPKPNTKHTKHTHSVRPSKDSVCKGTLLSFYDSLNCSLCCAVAVVEQLLAQLYSCCSSLALVMFMFCLPFFFGFSVRFAFVSFGVSFSCCCLWQVKVSA